MNESELIRPDWPAPANVGAFSTTRHGGVSRGPFESLNLGFGSGDEHEHVVENRRRLSEFLPAEPSWLRQVHGRRVVEPVRDEDSLPDADAQVTFTPGVPLAIMTADCLPVMFCDPEGERIGIAHAGWRGLAGGVIEATVEAMGVSPGRQLAWLGPAISGAVYEVGDDVREAFSRSAGHARRCLTGAFSAHEDRWRLDVSQAAKLILNELGVERVYGGGFCTYREPERFFSHRRDGKTGRMASLIWLKGTKPSRST